MKASAKTLQNFLDLLPLVLGKRYVAAVFGVAVANEILGEIERACDSSYFVGETGLLTLSGVTDYTLADSVRHVRGVYQVPSGDVVTDKLHPLSHEVLKSTLRLAEEPTLTSEDDISGTVAVGAPSDKSKVYDSTAGKLNTLDEDVLKSRLVRVTHASGTIEYRILKGNTPSSKTADINGELGALAAAGDAYLITANFLVIEHVRYLNRFTGVSSVLDLPQDFEFLFRAGMFYKYNLQADSLSKETKTWEEEYASQMSNFMADTTKIRGTSIRNSPRSMPSLFK